MSYLNLAQAGVNENDQALITGYIQYNALAEKQLSTRGMDRRERYCVTLSNPKILAKGSPALVKALPNSNYFYSKQGVPYCQFISVAPQSPRIFGANSDAPANGQLASECLRVSGSPVNLTAGQQVYVLVQVFRSSTYNNLSVGLEAVKIEDLNHPKVDVVNNSLMSDQSTNEFNHGTQGSPNDLPF